MKRMNDVFELPLPLDDVYGYGFATIREAAKIGRCPAAKHAAIAINNVDKLADALEMMIKHNWSAANMRKDAQKVAEQALAEYLGAL